MPSFSFAGVGSPGMTSMTFGEAKRRVAGISGATSRPAEHGAGEAIEMAIDELNRYRWDYLTVHGTDITLVDAAGLSPGQEGYQGQYTLPTPFKDPLSLIIGTGPPLRTLTFVPRSDWDAVMVQTLGGTYFYTNFQTGLTGKIQLLEPPASAGLMQVRYYRPIAKPADDNSPLDVPDGPLLAALLWKAKAQVALERGVFANRVGLLMSKAEDAVKQALGDDQFRQDDTPMLLPYRVWARGQIHNINSPHYWDVE